MDFVKKEWQFRDIISENELNRMEDGIEEGITKAEQAQGDISAHVARADNPHGVTKDQVGLGNVDNVKQATKVEHDQLSQTVMSHLDDKANPHEVTSGQINIIPAKNATDSPSTYPDGITTMYLEFGSPEWESWYVAGIPALQYTMIQTNKTGVWEISQTVTTSEADGQMYVYHRMSQDGVWGPLKRMATLEELNEHKDETATETNAAHVRFATKQEQLGNLGVTAPHLVVSQKNIVPTAVYRSDSFSNTLYRVLEVTIGEFRSIALRLQISLNEPSYEAYWEGDILIRRTTAAPVCRVYEIENRTNPSAMTIRTFVDSDNYKVRVYVDRGSWGTSGIQINYYLLNKNSFSNLTVDLEVTTEQNTVGTEVEVQRVYAGGRLISGEGNPEGSVTAGPGVLFSSSSGKLYIKEMGTGNTGWKEVLTAT